MRLKLAEALAVALNRSHRYGLDATPAEQAAAVLADPAFREALTVALSEAMTHHPVPHAGSEAAAIVAVMLP